MNDRPKRLRGFAALKARDPDYLKQIATKGGASVAPENRAFSKDRDLATRAGVAGGEASRGGGRKARDE